MSKLHHYIRIPLTFARCPLATLVTVEMFIIVPKPGGPASRVEPSDSARWLSRTQNACQSCKVRKAKVSCAVASPPSPHR